MSRIFLSHSSADDAEAIALSRWLETEGWHDHFLDLHPERGIAAGERWEKALNEAAHRCQAVVFLVSSSWLASDWCHRELQLAHRLDKHIFGVLIGDVDIASVPPKLKDHWQLVDLAGGRDHGAPIAVELPGGDRHVTFSRSGLQRLKAGLLKAEIDARFFAWPPKHDAERPPYRGMRPLEAEDAGIFFGREAPIIAVLDRLRGLREEAPPRFLAILGASGAGKSSFLRAGLIPRLARDDRNFLALPIVRPERAALSGPTGLAASLVQAMKASGLKVTRAAIDKAIADGPEAVTARFAELVAKARAPGLDAHDHPEPPTLVLSIDQGEELFQADGRDEARTLLELLAELLTVQAPKLIMLVTIRSDSYERLQVAPELEAIRQTAFSLPPLPRGAYQTVIEQPAERLKDTDRALKIEPALTAALLADIEEGGARDALPLLAFTLERLYLQHGGDGDLTLAEYRDLGGIGGSIEAAVERALLRADADPAVPRDRQAKLALLRRAMIPWLAGIDPETGSPRRQVARLSEIPQEARPLVQHLVAERLLSTEQAFATGEDADALISVGEATVEPAHEALLRQWSLLQGWLEEDAAKLATLEGVKRATRDWEANARHESWLSHQAGRLEDAERLQERPDLAANLSAAERAYLATARAAETARRDRELEEARKLADAQTLAAERQNQVARRTRIGAIAAMLLAAVAVGFGWYGLEQSSEAERQAQIAIERSEEAELQEAKARAETGRADAERNAALLAEANRVAAISEQFVSSGRPDIGMALALGVTPRSQIDERPLTPELESILHRAVASTAVPISRRLVDNAFNVAVSPDGRTLAAGTAGSDALKGTLHLFDADTMKERFRIKATDDMISGLDFSPDSNSVVVAGGKLPSVWNVASGEKRFELVPPDGFKGFTKLARFSPDGSFIAVSSSANEAFVYDASTGKIMHVLPGSDFDAMADRVKNAGAFGSADPIVDAVSRANWHIFGAASEIAISPDSSMIALSGSANLDGSVQIFDARTGQLKRLLTGGVATMLANPMGYGETLSFTADGRSVVASPLVNTIKVWDITSGQLRVEAPARDVESFVVLADGRALISGHRNGAIMFKCLEGLLETVSLQAHDDVVTRVVADTGSGLFLTTSRDGTAKLWRLPTSDDLCQPFDLSASVDGQSQMRPIVVLPGHNATVHTGLFAPGGRTVYTVSQDGFLRAWPMAPEASVDVDLTALMPSPEPDLNSNSKLRFFELALTPDGRMAFVRESSSDDYVLVDLETGSRLDAPPHIKAVAPRGVSGRPVLFSNLKHKWEFGDAPPEADSENEYFAGLDGPVSPTGDRALVYADGHFDTWALFDTGTGQPLRELKLGERNATDLVFSGDGSRVIGILAPEEDTAPQGLAVWRTDDGRLVAAAEEIAAFDYGTTLHVSDDGTRFLLAYLGETSPAVYGVVGNEILKIETPALERLDPKTVNSSVLSPDGRLAVTGHWDGTVAISLVGQSDNARVLPVGEEWIFQLTISPDGARLAAVDGTNAVSVVNVETGEITHRFNLPGGPLDLRDVKFAGGDKVVVSDDSGRLRVLAIRREAENPRDGLVRAGATAPVPSLDIDLTALMDPPEPDFDSEDSLRFDLVVTPDGKMAFIRGSSLDDYFVMDLRTGSLIDAPPHIKAVAPRAAAGRPVVFSDLERKWTFGDAPPEIEDEFVDFAGLDGALSPRGDRAVSYSDGPYETGALFDTERGQPLLDLKVGERKAVAIEFSGDGSRVIGELEVEDYSEPRGLAVWRADDGRLVAAAERITGLEYGGAVLHISDDGERFFLPKADGDTPPAVYSVVDDEIVELTTPALAGLDSTTITASALSPNGRLALTGHSDGTVAIVTVGEPDDARIVPVGDSSIAELSVSPSGARLAVVDSMNMLSVIDLSTGELRRRIVFAVEPHDVQFVDDDNVLVSDVEGRLRIFPIWADAEFFIDWLRATLKSNVSRSDSQKYGIAPTHAAPRPDLDALRDFPLPPRRTNVAPTESAAACDRLASNPSDRDRRAAGVNFEAFEAEAARPICELALSEAPDDPQTRYHMARIDEKLGNLEAAMHEYLATAAEGYAVAMRGVARLIALDKHGRFGVHGTPDEWMKRAAKADDSRALANMATTIALDPALPDGIERALAILSAEGISNRAEAAMHLALWIAQRGGADDVRERALFFALLGIELDATVAEAPDFIAQNLRIDIAGFVREQGRVLKPETMVAAYRAARDWRAGSTPY